MAASRSGGLSLVIAGVALVGTIAVAGAGPSTASDGLRQDLLGAAEPAAAVTPELDHVLDCTHRRVESRSPRADPPGCETESSAVVTLAEGLALAATDEVAVIADHPADVVASPTAREAGGIAVLMVALLFGLAGLLYQP